jgi:integrase
MELPQMRLTDSSIKAAASTEKSYKLFDGAGLYLEVSPSGGKWWRFKYAYAGKANRLSLGVYPEVKLKLARERRDEFRKMLAQGINPSAHRKATKAAQNDRAANSFEIIGREWHSKRCETLAPTHSGRILRRLERDLFPWLGARPIAEVTAREILACLHRIEERGALATAHRALQNCSQIMRYAVASGRADRDPTSDLRGALKPAEEQHFAAITDPKHVGGLLRAIDGFQGTFVVQCALKFAPLVFVRPGELRKAKWADINFEEAEWRFDVTKTKTQHIVPLSRQAVEILKQLHPLTGESEFVFPSGRGFARPMSDNAVLAALRRMSISKEEMCGHGFRAMARTILDEVLGFPIHLVEHQLAHAVRDPNGRAYNRTAHLPQRREMMQSWADYLESLKAGGDVVSLRQKI